MIRSLIVAMSNNRVIGCDGTLPWHLPCDLRRFKQITMGHTIIMGRRTFESIGRPLPGRTSIVLTRSPQQFVAASGVVVATNLQEAWRSCATDTESFVIGGGEIYRDALTLVDRLYVTRVLADVDGDTYFPPIGKEWVRTTNEFRPADDQNAYDVRFEIYERVENLKYVGLIKEKLMTATAELLSLSQRLLDCIAAADWKTYQTLCDSSITAFEAEARGHLVEGLPFHKFYFDAAKPGPAKLNTLTSPHVRMLGDDAAVVCYVRLIQCFDANGAIQTLKCEETRVWQRRDGQWKHVHFHRSGNN